MDLIPSDPAGPTRLTLRASGALPGRGHPRGERAQFAKAPIDAGPWVPGGEPAPAVRQPWHRGGIKFPSHYRNGLGRPVGGLDRRVGAVKPPGRGGCRRPHRESAVRHHRTRGPLPVAATPAGRSPAQILGMKPRSRRRRPRMAGTLWPQPLETVRRPVGWLGPVRCGPRAAAADCCERCIGRRPPAATPAAPGPVPRGPRPGD